MQAALFYMYLLRVQILGFLILWPGSSVLFESPMFRGLTELGAKQLFQIEIIVAIYVVFLVCSSNLVLLHGRERVSDDPARCAPKMPAWITTYAVPGLGVLLYVLFVGNVVSQWTPDRVLWTFWAALTLASGLGSPFYLLVLRRGSARLAYGSDVLARLWLAAMPLPTPVTPHAGAASPDSADAAARGGPQAASRSRPAGGFLRASLQFVVRAAQWTAAAIGRLGPGYSSGGKTHSLQIVVYVLFVYFLAIFYGQGSRFGDVGFKFLGFQVTDPWETTGSTLLLAILGVQFLIGLLCLVTFFGDRFRLPISTALLALIIAASILNRSETTFFAKPTRPEHTAALRSPQQILAETPGRLIVVAAAGGGIQSSGWTAEVLTRLTEENAEFANRLKVISAVSGGAVGTAFYLGSRAGVWADTPTPADKIRRNATSSFLEDVAWGLVFPDLHRLLFPIEFWGNMDRGRALEAAIARTAGGTVDKGLLELRPDKIDNMPVFIFNATLTASAVPVVFTNSRFPDPAAPRVQQRAIRSFWHDYQLDTRLETAARISATFPYISPAARPEPLLGNDAFVDGGFFDNSGLYSLMAWLQQASSDSAANAPSRDVLLIAIDAFPERERQSDRTRKFSWYDQLLLPMATVLGVRETGQAARTEFEFPLLAQTLSPALKVQHLQFRYRPSPRCALEPPPLSWRLTEKEKDCIAEAWNEEQVLKMRALVTRWLGSPS